jgi:hypothetical protein
VTSETGRESQGEERSSAKRSTTIDHLGPALAMHFEHFDCLFRPAPRHPPPPSHGGRRPGRYERAYWGARKFLGTGAVNFSWSSGAPVPPPGHDQHSGADQLVADMGGRAGDRPRRPSRTTHRRASRDRGRAAEDRDHLAERADAASTTQLAATHTGRRQSACWRQACHFAVVRAADGEVLRNVPVVGVQQIAALPKP